MKKKYDSKTMYCRGLSMIEKNGLYGLVDIYGKEILPCKYILITSIANFGFKLYKKFSNAYLCGIADIYGKEIIPCQFEDIYLRKSDTGVLYYKTHLNTGKMLYGLVNIYGKEILPCKYDLISDISDRTILAKENNTWYYLSEKGRIKLKFSNSEYLECHNFHAGLACVMNANYKWGYIDKTGDESIPCQFNFPSEYNSDGFCIQYENNKNNIILDRYCKEVMPLLHNKLASYVGNKLFAVTIAKNHNNTMYALYDKDKQLTQYKFSSIGKFVNGIAIVTKNNLFGAINKHGDEIIPCIHNNAHNYSIAYHDDDVIVFGEDGNKDSHKLIFYDLTGKSLKINNKSSIVSNFSLNVYYTDDLKYIYCGMGSFFGTLDQFIEMIYTEYYNYIRHNIYIFYEYMNIISEYVKLRHK